MSAEVAGPAGKTATRRPPEPDPRIERSRAAVIDAARTVLLDAGIAGFSLDAVIQLSGVARATIYRHWVSRDELVRATVDTFLPDIEAPDKELGFEGRLRFVLQEMAASFGDPESRRFLPVLIEASRNPEWAQQFERHSVSRQRLVLIDVLNDGISDGDLPEAADPNDAVLQLIGPLFLAALDPTATLDDGLAMRMADRYLASWR